MVLVNISSLDDPIRLKMHILIVSNESRLKRDDFRVFKKKIRIFWARQAILRPNMYQFSQFRSNIGMGPSLEII